MIDIMTLLLYVSFKDDIVNKHLHKLSRIKEDGLIREHSSNFKPTFYPNTVFRLPRPLQEGVLSCRWPADVCIVYFRTGKVTRDNSILCDSYFLAARWTMHAEIYSLRSYCTYLWLCDAFANGRGMIVSDRSLDLVPSLTSSGIIFTRYF